MNRSTHSPNIVTLNSRAGVVTAAIPVRRRRKVAASERLLVRLVRRVFRSNVVTMTVERRPVRTKNDESTRIALTRDGISIDQGRPRGGARNLDGGHYDLLRQFR
jgi:hypothetical protein